jgi:transposase
MAKATAVSAEKIVELRALLITYRKEIDALIGLHHTWRHLSDKAKKVCAKDFDEAIVAREALLEELHRCKHLETKTMLNEVDMGLMDNAKIASDLYGFDAKAYLSEVQKKLPPAK